MKWKLSFFRSKILTNTTVSCNETEKLFRKIFLNFGHLLLVLLYLKNLRGMLPTFLRTASMVITAIFFFLDGKCVNSLNTNRALFTRGPPSDTVTDKGRGGGREYGIRLISKSECQEAVRRWIAKFGVASGVQNLEKLELLLLLQNFAEIMPGRKPQRNELVALGDFVDGNIECIAAVYWRKILFPSEMEVISIYQPSTTLENKNLEMIKFILEMCRDNAIIPQFESLEKYEIFQQPSYFKYIKTNQSSQQKNNIADHTDNENISYVIMKYSSINKSPSIYLDKTNAMIDLGPYWYKTELKHNKNNNISIPIYFRRKNRRDNYEYEILFSKPMTGTETGYGTVGGALIISVDDMTPSSIITNVISVDNMITVANAVKSKITHPEI